MRHFRARDSVVIALSVMLLAACAAQPTSPADAGDGSDPEGSIISLEVNPSRAVIQPNDTIVFDVEMVVSEDLESIPDLEWTASRGSISSDGVFIAGRRAGKIDVTVKPRGREKKARAEIHVVEEEPPVASSVEISPETASLNSGETQSLSAAVLDQNGAPMSLTPVWSALGGTITRGGEYTAGAVEGLFPVAATVSPDVADTAWITITSLPPDTQDTQPVGPAGNWSLIMADEFDDAALDPSLWQLDFSHDGFQWLDFNDVDNSVIGFARNGFEHGDHLVCVFNFTPQVIYNYKMGVPEGVSYQEICNSDLHTYGGSNVLNINHLDSVHESFGFAPYHVKLNLPPLGGVVLKPLNK